MNEPGWKKKFRAEATSRPGRQESDGRQETGRIHGCDSGSDAARKQISAFETQVLEQMEVFDTAEKELAERAPEVDKLRGEMEASFKAFDEQAKVQQQQLEAARAEHERLLRELPKATSAFTSASVLEFATASP